MDPKSIYCAFFKQGLCKKGNKCKFSHDPAVEKKSAKRNIYADAEEKDNMEDWDDEKLADVVNKKHAGEKSNATDIVRSPGFDSPCCNYVLMFTDLQILPGRGGEQQVRLVLDLSHRG